MYSQPLSSQSVQPRLPHKKVVHLPQSSYLTGTMFAVKLIVVGLLFALGLVVRRRIMRNSRRKRLLLEPLKSEWKAILQESMPLYKRLPERLRSQLDGLINLFLSEKTIEGCGGLEITDQVKVVIAAQACILLLDRKTKYFPILPFNVGRISGIKKKLNSLRI